MRQLSGQSYRRLKSATDALFSTFGGQESAALFTRVGQQSLSRYACLSKEAEDRFAPCDIIADIEVKLGTPVVTATLADLSGHMVIKRPGPMLQSGNSARDLGNLAKESGEAVSTYATAIADGKVSVAEAKKIRAELLDNIAISATLVEQMDQIIGDAE